MDLRAWNSIAYKGASCAMSGVPDLLQDQWLASDELSSFDFAHAFLQLRAAPESVGLQAWKCPLTSKIYAFQGLALGNVLSGSFFCATSGLINEILRHQGAIDSFASTYVDDVMLRSRKNLGKRDCADSIRIFAAVNATRSVAKDKPPAPSQVLLGLAVSSPELTVRSTEKSVYKALLPGAVLEALERRGVAPKFIGLPRQQLESLAGRLSWCGQCTYSGRMHSKAVHALASYARERKIAWIQASPNLRADLAWWRERAESGQLRGEHFINVEDYTAISGITSSQFYPGDAQLCDDGRVIHSRSDAAGENGYAAIAGGVVVHGDLTTEKKRVSPRRLRSCGR